MSIRAEGFGGGAIAHGFGTRADAATDRAVTVHQVHGDRIVAHDECVASTEADAIIARVPAVRVAVRTADCLPILLYSPRRAAVAAVHAGWRGLAASIPEKAVRALDPAYAGQVEAAVGPGIGACCFEVGAECAAALKSVYPDVKGAYAPSTRSGHLLVNLRLLAHASLARARVVRVFDVDLCTRCRPDLFHSFRRDAGAAGRQLNWIEVKAAPLCTGAG